MGQYESITEKEKTTLVEVWTWVKKDLPTVGTALFNVISVDFPQMINYFPFKGPSDDGFDRHVERFMSEMDSWVTQVYNLPVLKKLIGRLGVTHAKHKIRPEDFENMRRCIIKALLKVGGPQRFPSNDQKVYDKVIAIAFESLKAAGDWRRLQH